MNEQRKVLAFQLLSLNVIKLYGEGIYIGDKIPNTTPFNRLKSTEPCILLDNGKYIWGYQCYWEDFDTFQKKKERKYRNTKIETVTILNEVKPMKEKDYGITTKNKRNNRKYGNSSKRS